MLILAALSTGSLVGLGIGAAITYPRGHRDGVEAGKAQVARDDAAWRNVLDASPGYAQTIPHGRADHTCSTRCKPRQ